jgi:hypothetical protein
MFAISRFSDAMQWMAQYSECETASVELAQTSSGRPEDALQCEMDLPLRRHFYPLGYPIEIITNHPGVLDAAMESFGHNRSKRKATGLQIRVGVSSEEIVRCPDEPARRAFNHLYSLVSDAKNQALLDLRTGVNFVWVTRAAAENRLYLRSNFIEKVVYLLLGATVVTDIHSACVSKNGRGILLSGDSGAGKTTLAYACARAGWSYTSDDTSYLINDSTVPKVIGHCHRIRFRPTTRLLFPELEKHPLTPRMEGKPSIEVRTCDLPVERTSAEAEIHAVVFLSRQPGKKSKLIRLPNGTAHRRFCEGLFSVGEVRAKHENILQRFSNVATYQLQYEDLDDAIDALDQLTMKD